ncbi:MAG: hypothetical protein AAGA15_03015 [Pseudomonadota bacterium]
MFNLRKFVDDKDGAITVDWVVLTAAVVGLGFAIVATLASGTVNVGSTVDGELDEIGTRLKNDTILN